MILYNVTVILEEDIEKKWLSWMQNVHIDRVMDTGCFASNRMLRVLDSPNEGVTYCIQYVADTLDKYKEYQARYSSTYEADFPFEFSNKFVSFSTVMEFVQSR